VNAPISGGNQMICSNQSIPALSASTEINETIDWYNSPTGGILLLQGSTSYTPSSAGTYYVEGRNLLTGCKSTTRTPVSLIMHQTTKAQIVLSKNEICSGDSIILSISSNSKLKWSTGENSKLIVKSPLVSTEYFVIQEHMNGCADTVFAKVNVKEVPPINLLSTTCDGSTTTWSLKYTTNINNKIIIDSIIGIKDSVYFLTINGAGCTSSILVNKPDCSCLACDCITIPAPNNVNGDVFYCKGDPIPALRVNHQSGAMVDWYDSKNNLLQHGDTFYYPLQDGIYYAQSKSIINPNCINHLRVSWRVTVLPPISLTVDSIFCSEDLRTWGFRFKQNGIFAIQGFEVINDIVYNIPIDSSSIRIFISNNVCDTTYTIMAPKCSCSITGMVTAQDTVLCYPDTSTNVLFTIDSAKTMTKLIQYSLDGKEWKPEGLFKSVKNGIYMPQIRNSHCVRQLDTLMIDTVQRMYISYQIDTPTCDNINGGSIRLMVKGGLGSLSYAWNNGDSTFSIANLDSGEYKVIIIDSKGCSQQSNFILPEVGNFKFKLDSLKKITVCSGVPYPISLPDGFKYIWTGPNNFREDSSRVTLRDSGWYYVYAFNKDDCMQHDSIYLSYSKEFFNARFLLPDEGLLNQKIMVPEISWPIPDSIKWSYDQTSAVLQSKNLNQYLFSFTVSGIHTLKMHAFKFGCESVVEKTIKIVGDSSGLTNNIPGTKLNNLKTVKLFPNPNNGRFTVEVGLDTSSDVLIRIYDIAGIIKSSRLLKGAALYREFFELNDLPNGVFSLLLQNGFESEVIHFIIQK
jgi:hypothetical protein